jgi:DNA mismatch repair protein MutS2
MKAYAQSTPGVATASFGYHPDTYEPTFKLTLGAPGRSLALEMAERLGLPADVVADARGRRDDKEQQAEALLARLEREKAELARERVRIDAVKAAAEGAKARAVIAEREIQVKKRREVEAFAKELKRRADEVERKAAEAIRSAVEKVEAAHKAAAAAPRLRTETVRAIRDARDEVLKDPELAIPEEQEAPAQELEVGMRVRVKAMGVAGELLGLQGEEAEVAISGKRLRLPRAELVALSGKARHADSPHSRRGTSPGSSIGEADGSARLPSSWGGFAPPSPPVTAKSVPAEVNLIGLTVDEARERLDKVLDDAALSDRREIRLIHGFGAGKLRKAVAQMLEGHPLVSSWRLGGPSEGGGGATVVELKE